MLATGKSIKERIGFSLFSTVAGVESDKQGRSLMTEETLDSLTSMVKTAVNVFSKANEARVDLKHIWNIQDDEENQ